MAKKDSGKSWSFGKIILIILVIAFLGPLIFLGACFPIGAVGASMGDSASGAIILVLAWIIGAALALFVVFKLVKKIYHYQ
jgi:hypothetical protein